MADLQAGSFAAGDNLDLLDDNSDTAVTAANAMRPDDLLILLWELVGGSGGFD
jgi:hypothetical protein